MARTDWTALLTEPAAEYTAHTELQRLGLAPYLPQLRKRQHTRVGACVTRSFPLFPRYLLILAKDAYHPSIRFARGVARSRHILADTEGRLWRAPQRVIDAVREAERRGFFDEILHKGDPVTLTSGVLASVCSVLTDTQTAGMIELLTPLFGGSRATIAAAKVASP